MITKVVIAVTAAAAMVPATPSTGIEWKPCADATTCAQLTVPADWSHPGRTTTIQLARLPAAKQKTGTLFFNPGGPGEGEVGYLQSKQAREYYFPQAIRDNFDIVAVEPRGTGSNPPLTCPLPIDNSVTKFPRNQTEVDALLASNGKLGRRCATDIRLDTVNVARDMDAARAAIGEQQVSVLGVSYGSMLAQAYAELFPHRVRAMVVDAIVDRSRPWQQLAADDALAVEDGVNRFARWCKENAECALHDADVHQTLVQLQSRADAGQIKDGDRAVRAEEIAAAVNTGMQDPGFYSPLAQGLKKTTETGALGDLAGLTPAKNPDYSVYRAIICQDVPVPVSQAAQLPALAAKLRTVAPTLRGYSEFWDIASGCAGWPATVRWTPHNWTVPADFPAPLLLSGAHDVATPRIWAENVQRALPGSRLVRWDGDGHAAWPAHDAGAVTAAVDFLTK
ncbi:alpha/beta fold hydrolase [Fodinicola acaciae]|uniref:alpha/beta fold hydrolase n=1 Tax=Fodinicola acaciae TaxID=2681555 RepID=UPI0013D86319|nr:alpha/beta fold hydrolase [Fodinicola acaciae]